MGISMLERWESDKNSQRITVCINCKHYEGNYKCKAFAERIPAEIINGSNDHSKPLADQENNVVFEPEIK